MLPSSHDVTSVVDHLIERGVDRAVTPALSYRDAQPFLKAGFTIHEQLHLLALDLRHGPDHRSRRIASRLPAGYELRPGRRWHESNVIKVDGAAFEPFWRFDAEALREARRATPRHRYRVVTSANGVQGYAVTGLAGQRGYLQRLAVDPQAEGQGLGRFLVDDAFRWLRRRHATRMMVNTQERNQRALTLYRNVGFEQEPSGLVVLEWTG
jgi:GNAT superfamily N-acetyltransferase